MSSSHCKEGSL